MRGCLLSGLALIALGPLAQAEPLRVQLIHKAPDPTRALDVRAAFTCKGMAGHVSWTSGRGSKAHFTGGAFNGAAFTEEQVAGLNGLFASHPSNILGVSVIDCESGDRPSLSLLATHELVIDGENGYGIAQVVLNGEKLESIDTMIRLLQPAS